MNRSIAIVIAIAIASVAMSGCGDRFLSTPEKINQAFPPIAEVRVAVESVRAVLMEDPQLTQAFDRHYAARMQLRAMICAQAVTVGRLDSVAKVKGYAVNRDCLNEQDTQLLQYVGIQHIGLLLIRPALRPLVPLGPPMTVPSGGGSDVYGAHAAAAAAAAAGVGVLSGMRGELISVELPGGKKIATLGSVATPSASILVSPNGRLVAVRSHTNSVVFIDTESGSKLWETKDLKQFYGWLPELSAALASDAKTGALALIDFNAGTVAPHPIALREPAWAVHVSTAPSRVLVGGARLFSVIEHVRSGLVVKASTLKQLQVRQGQGMLSVSPPTLMHGGKSIFFTSGRDLALMSLETGVETVWPSGELFTGRYAKLSESTLLVDTSERDSTGAKVAIFDIDKATLAPVAAGETGNGTLTDLPGRIGFARRNYQELWLGDTVKSGEPATLDSLVTASNLARQIARLEAVTQDGAGGDDGAFSASSAAPTFTIATPSMSFATPSRAAPPARSALSSAPGQDAILTSMARVARMEAVGVYQGSAATTGAQGRKVGNVDVRVRRGKPIILVLSSYEPVRWRVVQESGARVVSVLLSGYHQSEVTGVGNARVVNTGSSYAYEAGSAQQAALNRQTALYTGKTIDSFQGRYEGSTFTVGAQ